MKLRVMQVWRLKNPPKREREKKMMMMKRILASFLIKFGANLFRSLATRARKIVFCEKNNSQSSNDVVSKQSS